MSTSSPRGGSFETASCQRTNWVVGLSRTDCIGWIIYCIAGQAYKKYRHFWLVLKERDCRTETSLFDKPPIMFLSHALCKCLIKKALRISIWIVKPRSVPFNNCGLATDWEADYNCPRT